MPRNYAKAAPNAHQRLPEYQRGDDWIQSLLGSAHVAHIAHASGGQPFVTPNTFWYDKANNRVIFHANVAGRLRSNLEANPKVCLEVSESGRLLPSNAALEFSMQYRSVLVYGTVCILEDAEEKRAALYGLIGKYFPGMQPGREFRPITDKELARTSVYALRIEFWSGKENWQDQAEMTADWPPLPDEILDPQGRQ
jgi:nitroimidazol reductase NimA-like FMN-containing flavoprotein (pyridoxamine 5'-phosphate oxidase superfamily)